MSQQVKKMTLLSLTRVIASGAKGGNDSRGPRPWGGRRFQPPTPPKRRARLDPTPKTSYFRQNICQNVENYVTSLKYSEYSFSFKNSKSCRTWTDNLQ